MKKYYFLRLQTTLTLAFVFLFATLSAMAQTFRGGIAGTILDAGGAAIPHAKITLSSTETGLVRETTSTENGTYSFQDLPLGKYTVKVESAGFSTANVEDIVVRTGQVFPLSPKLSISASNTQVDVLADAVAIDTVSSVNNSDVPAQAVQNIPLNGRDFTQLLKIVPGMNGAGSLNGTRTNQNNYQIDGIDNNDIFHNSVGANQGGVSGIAGVTLPIEAIDQFSVQSQGNAEVGRNGGGLISMALKHGTNKFHGSAYYYFRNEFFAAKSPFVGTANRKPKIRNNQFGGSLGGPIAKDKLLFFVNYERQKYIIGATGAATEPTDQWVTNATSLLSAHKIAVSPTMLNVLEALWPRGNKAGAATTSNFIDSRPQSGYSDNTVGNLTWNINDKQNLYVRAFIGTGRQLGNAGVNIWDYYQVAPDHVHNYAVTHNWAISPRLTNQILVGANYFGQTFNDNVHNQNIPALGLNTEVTDPTLYGAPSISITGFDSVGVTPPLGRQDYTGQVSDILTYVVGKHQLRVGGEFRRNYMNLLYQRSVRGSFTFDGTASAVVDPSDSYVSESDGSTRALADFLAGYAASGSIVRGVLQRDIYLNQWSIFAQDQYQFTPTLTINYGVRWDYSGPFYSPTGTLSNFNPNATSGFSIAGKDIDTIYPRRYTNVSPRLGFAYSATPKLAIRGTYGLYFDLPNLNGFFDNRPGNGAAVGVQANNTGLSPVFTASKSSPFQIVTNVDPLPSSGTTFGATLVSSDFKNAYVQNFNLNMEYQLGHNTVAQVGYVGSLGRHLFNVRDINQAETNTNRSTDQTTRPYYSKFPNITAINQFESEGGSNYSSLQAMLRTSSFHGITAQGSYTYGHAFDNVSGTRNLAPQNSLNLAGEYGNADFDIRHTFNGYIVYEIPTFGGFKPLTSGWEVNSFLTFYTGKPLTPKAGSNISGTGEGQDRAVLVASPKSGNYSIHQTSSGAYVQWFTTSGFALPTLGTFSPTQRNSVRAPGFGTVDASLVKNTTIREGVKLQLRAEMFNIFNRINLAAPGVSSLTSSSFGQSTDTIGDANGAPGIGSGEPFNVQFAAKLIF